MGAMTYREQEWGVESRIVYKLTNLKTNMKIKTQTKEKDELWYFNNSDAWFSPGQMLKMKFSSHQSVGEVILPVLVTNVNLRDYGPPSVDIIFSLKWSHETEGGGIKIKDLMLGRYVPEKYDFSEEEIQHLSFFTANKKSMFYININSETDTERELIYPFCT